MEVARGGVRSRRRGGRSVSAPVGAPQRSAGEADESSSVWSPPEDGWPKGRRVARSEEREETKGHV